MTIVRAVTLQARHQCDEVAHQHNVGQRNEPLQIDRQQTHRWVADELLIDPLFNDIVDASQSRVQTGSVTFVGNTERELRLETSAKAVGSTNTRKEAYNRWRES